MSTFLENYQKLLQEQYKTAGGLNDLPSRLGSLISDVVVEVPAAIYKRIAVTVKDIYSYSHSAQRIARLRDRLKRTGQALGNIDLEILNASSSLRNSSVLMAYDFHYHPQTQQLSLIEINTNGAAFLLSDLLYQMPGTAQKFWPQARDSLKRSFHNELKLTGFSGTPRTLIMDESPTQQHMYIEFLMFKEIFKSWGWPAEIAEPDAALKALQQGQVNFIYNRYTDFKLASPLAREIFHYYVNGKVVVSPNPREYVILSEKKNLIEFASEQVSESLIPTFETKMHPNPEEIWEQRKKLIFKPTSSYGSKGVYKGVSISRKVFEEIVPENFLAQEFRPPGEIGPWKFDLRFYVYQDEIQLGIARVYQGQVTNFRTAGGGLARLIVK